MTKIKDFIKQYRLSILSGLLVGTSYIPFPPWALFFCYAPLWFELTQSYDNLNIKNVFKKVWLTQFILTLIGFHWITYLVYEFGQLPWVLGVAALILFSALVHLYIPLSAVFVFLISKKLKLNQALLPFLFALSLGLTERVWPSIFPWHLGYPLLSAKIPMYHWADTIGFEGLSILVLVINAFFAWIYLNWNNVSLRRKSLITFVSLFLILNLFGFLKGWLNSQKLNESPKVSTLNMTLIQGNIGNLDKAYAEQGRDVHFYIIDQFTDLMTSAFQKFPNTELFVWPETAYPDILNSHRPPNNNLNYLTSKLKQWHRPLLTGAYSVDPPGAAKRQTYNAVFLIDPEGKEIANPYHKTELLIFGEYLPFEEYLQWFAKFIQFSSSFGRGPGPQILTLPEKAHLGIQICYEGLYPEFTRSLSQKGAEILTNHTNDSWFGVPFEPRQHLYMTLARAIEVRRPLIRSTNTGISAAILSDGTILEKSPTHEKWFTEYKIRFLKNPEQSDFVIWGHFDYIFWGLVFIMIVLWSKKRNANPT